MDVLENDERRRAHLYGDFGPEWLGEPDKTAYGVCEVCGAPRRVRRRVDEREQIRWDKICSSVGCLALG